MRSPRKPFLFDRLLNLPWLLFSGAIFLVSYFGRFWTCKALCADVSVTGCNVLRISRHLPTSFDETQRHARCHCTTRQVKFLYILFTRSRRASNYVYVVGAHTCGHCDQQLGLLCVEEAALNCCAGSTVDVLGRGSRCSSNPTGSSPTYVDIGFQDVFVVASTRRGKRRWFRWRASCLSQVAHANRE